MLNKNQIVKLIKNQEFKEAEIACKNYIENNHNDGEIYYYLGIVYSFDNDSLEAKKYFDKAIKLGYINSEIYFNRAIANNNLKKYLYAIEDYKKAVEYFNENIGLGYTITDCYFYIASCYVRLNMYKESIEYSNKIIEINNFDKISYSNRGLCKSYLSKYDEAIEDCLKSIEIDNSYVPAYNNLGIFYSYIEKYEQALKYFDKGINIIHALNMYGIYIYNKYFIDLHLHRGITKYYLNKYEEAIKDFDIGIKYNNKYAGLYFHRGLTKQELAKKINDNNLFLEAIKDYNSSIKYLGLSYNKLKIHINKAECFRYLNDKENESNLYKTFIEESKLLLEKSKSFEYTYFLFDDLKKVKNNIEINSYYSLLKDIILYDLKNDDRYNINKTLFNYTKINKDTIKNILNEEIWLSNTKLFNDPVDPSIKRKNKNNEYYNDLLDRIKVGCLSSKNDNTLMWSHYADKHKGICIEYNISKIFIDNNSTIRKVNYDKNMVEEKMDYIKRFSDIKIGDKNITKLLELFYIKSKEWEYEDEYRILYYDATANSNGITIKLPIKSIYFGTETSEEDKKLIYDIIKNINITKTKNNKIKIYESKFDDKKLFEIKTNKKYIRANSIKKT